MGWCSGGLWGSAVCGGSLGDLTLQMRVGGREGGVWECVGGQGRRGGEVWNPEGLQWGAVQHGSCSPDPIPAPSAVLRAVSAINAAIRRGIPAATLQALLEPGRKSWSPDRAAEPSCGWPVRADTIGGWS